jgi:hypothetical protein
VKEMDEVVEGGRAESVQLKEEVHQRCRNFHWASRGVELRSRNTNEGFRTEGYVEKLTKLISN